jgi:hypothetical protein
MKQDLAHDRVQLDLSRFPLVVVSEQGALDDAQRAEMVEALDELLERRGRHALVLDLRAGRPLPDAQRMYVSECFGMRGDLIAEKWAAVAVVVATPLLSHLPTGAFWIRVSPAPAKVFTRVDDAEQWARTLLNQRNSGEVVVPASLARRKLG